MTIAPGGCQVASGGTLKWTRRTKVWIWGEEGAHLLPLAPAALSAASLCLASDYFRAVKTAAVASCCLPEPNISPTCPDIPYSEKVLMAAWQTSLWSWCCVVTSAAGAPSQPHQRVGSCWHYVLRHRGVQWCCHSVKNESKRSEHFKNRVILAVYEVWGFFLLGTFSAPSHFMQLPAAY